MAQILWTLELCAWLVAIGWVTVEIYKSVLGARKEVKDKLHSAQESLDAVKIQKLADELKKKADEIREAK